MLALLLVGAGASPAAARTHRKPSVARPDGKSAPALQPAPPVESSPPIVPSAESEPPPAPLEKEAGPAPSTDVEPPPAPLTEVEPPEPPPAPLLAIETPLPKEATPPPTDTRARQRGLRGAGWVGVAATLGLATAGVVLGALTQQRSDALSLSTVQHSGGLPPIYDAAQHLAYTDLQNQGRTFNNATIACFAVGGVLALTSGILFWKAAALQGKSKPLALRSVGVSAGGGMVLTGSF